MATKTCTVCKVEKPVTAEFFQPGVTTLDGFRHQCKACRAIKSRQNYEAKVGRSVRERQFLPGMGWHNSREWQVDHILPASSFKFSGMHCAEFKACWALSNLRPLWARDNLVKRAKLEYLI